MNPLLIITSVCFCIVVSIYLHFYICPFIKNKYNLYKASFLLRRIAKKHKKINPELYKQLIDIAKGVDEINKQEKIIEE